MNGINTSQVRLTVCNHHSYRSLNFHDLTLLYLTVPHCTTVNPIVLPHPLIPHPQFQLSRPSPSCVCHPHYPLAPSLISSFRQSFSSLTPHPPTFSHRPSPFSISDETKERLHDSKEFWPLSFSSFSSAVFPFCIFTCHQSHLHTSVVPVRTLTG